MRLRRGICAGPKASSHLRGSLLRTLLTFLRQCLMFFKQIHGKLFGKLLWVSGLFCIIHSLTIIQRNRIIFEQFCPAVFDDTLCHFHGFRVTLIPLVNDSRRLGQCKVSFCRIDIINRKSADFVGNCLLAQTKTDRYLSGTDKFQWAGTGFLDMIARIFIDIFEYLYL